MLHFFAILTATIGVTAAQPTEQQWESDYRAALKQTRSDDRPLLIVIDQPATQEQSLSSDVLNNGAEGALADYDLCHVDASTKYGKKVADAFNADSYPYIAFVDKSGSVILHSETGQVTGETWTSLVMKYRTGEKPVKRTVSKPVVKTATVSASYKPYKPSPRPYCAKCQRGY